MCTKAVAVFDTRSVKGDVLFVDRKGGLYIHANFTKVPKGKHGFHLHSAGDMRGDGCKLACDHYQKGEKQNHGGPPGSKGPRHTGDLGNIEGAGDYSYTLAGVCVEDILGRSVIVHADEDDYGLGGEDDSLKTGHAGARIACGIIGRLGGKL
jgi:Cu-Zn family superoxide dismutase